MMGIKGCQRMKSPASYFTNWETWALGSGFPLPHLPPHPTQHPTPYSLGTTAVNHGRSMVHPQGQRWLHYSLKAGHAFTNLKAGHAFTFKSSDASF